jgi:hypothetical protein
MKLIDLALDGTTPVWLKLGPTPEPKYAIKTE